MIESVTVLRNSLGCNKNMILPSSGYYRWWFDENATRQLLANIKFTSYNMLQVKVIDGKQYYSLYFGISKNVKQRLKWHILQKHSPSAIKKGFLSTLRHTLSALLGNNASMSEGNVNNLIDNSCYIEWDYTNNPKEIESKELSSPKYVYPLNIQGNKIMQKNYSVSLSNLKNLRKMHKK